MNGDERVIYIKPRIYVGDVSIILPNKVRLNTSGLEFESGISMTDIDTDSLIYIQKLSDKYNAREFLTNHCLEDMQHLSEIISVSRGGLKGFYIMYESAINEYCEYRFDLEKHEGKFIAISLVIETDKDKTDIKTVMKTKKMKKFINSLRLENQK